MCDKSACLKRDVEITSLRAQLVDAKAELGAARAPWARIDELRRRTGSEMEGTDADAEENFKAATAMGRDSLNSHYACAMANWGISMDQRDELKAQLSETKETLGVAREQRDALSAQLAEAKAVNKGWFYTQTDYTDLLAQLAALTKAADALAEALAAFLILRLEARGRESGAAPIAKAIQLGEAALAAYQKARGGL